jgi:hypothetical protein
MIKITVELLPLGFENGKETLGIAEIWNTGEGTKTKGNYKFRIFDKGGSIWKSGDIVGFPRKKLLVWDLNFYLFK